MVKNKGARRRSHLSDEVALIRRRRQKGGGGSYGLTVLPRLHVYEQRRDVEAPDVGASRHRLRLLLVVVRRVQKWAKQCQGA